MAERWPRRIALAAALGLFVFDLFGHEMVSDWCRMWSDGIGFGAFDSRARLVLVAACGFGVALALFARRSRPPGRVIAGIAALAIASVLAHRFLIVNNVELIHLPQYALIAALLVAGGVPPRVALGLTTLAGILDELHQYWVGMALRPELTYVDYNDMVLNALGGTWAIVLASPAPGPISHRATWWWAVVAVVFGAAAVIDPPGWTVHYGAFDRAYYLLSCSLAVGVTAPLWAVAGWLNPRR